MRLISLSAAAERLGICKRTLARCIRNRGLPVVRIGSRVLIAEDALAAWIAGQQRVESDEEATAA